MNAPTLAHTRGIVLAGTHPWSHSTFDGLLPRTLLPIAHRPLIAYALSWLAEGGVEDVAVCANRETQLLQPQLKGHVPRDISLAYYKDTMPRGAAGALRDAATGGDADTLIIADGTSVPTVDLPELLSAHHSSRAAVTIVVHSEPGRNGNPSLQVPSGIYAFSREAVDLVPDRGFFDIKEHLIPRLYQSGGRVTTFTAPRASPRVLDVSSYLAVNEWMVERLATNGEAVNGYQRVGTGVFHQDALIADDSVLVGPVLVAPGARIMSGAVIVGPVSIGRDAKIGRGAVVSRSAIWRRAVVGQQVVADRCILADDSVVEPYTQIFRAVRVANSSRKPETIRAVSLDAQEKGSLDLLRKMRRAVIGGTWSRSTSAP
jgi:mannose-1-phosphate guanylyltransferase